ncbi:hypothetical protein Sjap_023613 [Stephania japonica]|uniref:Response regulatory domain-containing protein n=1 Tax=Stephania japonica TaxID=461633 RepID=A0AAP0HN52_9MAGN
MGSSAEIEGKNVTVDEKEAYFTKKLTALVVDDNKMHRMIHKKLLATLGVESQEAENGKEAVDICLSGEAFNLILMDYDMPVMDGREGGCILVEVLRWLKIPSTSMEMEFYVGDHIYTDPNVMTLMVNYFSKLQYTALIQGREHRIDRKHAKVIVMQRLDDKISPMLEADGEHFNKRYADIYTSRVLNFLHHTPFMYFRSQEQTLAHDACSSYSSSLNGFALDESLDCSSS